MVSRVPTRAVPPGAGGVPAGRAPEDAHRAARARTETETTAAARSDRIFFTAGWYVAVLMARANVQNVRPVASVDWPDPYQARR